MVASLDQASDHPLPEPLLPDKFMQAHVDTQQTDMCLKVEDEL